MGQLSSSTVVWRAALKLWDMLRSEMTSIVQTSIRAQITNNRNADHSTNFNFQVIFTRALSLFILFDYANFKFPKYSIQYWIQNVSENCKIISKLLIAKFCVFLLSLLALLEFHRKFSFREGKFFVRISHFLLAARFNTQCRWVSRLHTSLYSAIMSAIPRLWILLTYPNILFIFLFSVFISHHRIALYSSRCLCSLARSIPRNPNKN